MNLTQSQQQALLHLANRCRERGYDPSCNHPPQYHRVGTKEATRNTVRCLRELGLVDTKVNRGFRHKEGEGAREFTDLWASLSRKGWKVVNALEGKAAESAAVLDHYFTDLTGEPVREFDMSPTRFRGPAASKVYSPFTAKCWTCGVAFPCDTKAEADAALKQHLKATTGHKGEVETAQQSRFRADERRRAPASGNLDRFLDQIREAISSGTVKTFLMVMSSMITQQDKADAARALKRGGRPNIYALGILLGALHKVEDAMKGMEHRDDDEALSKLKTELSFAFTSNYPALKKTLKQIDAWMTSKKKPTLIDPALKSLTTEAVKHSKEELINLLVKELVTRIPAYRGHEDDARYFVLHQYGNSVPKLLAAAQARHLVPYDWEVTEAEEMTTTVGVDASQPQPMGDGDESPTPKEERRMREFKSVADMWAQAQRNPVQGLAADMLRRAKVPEAQVSALATLDWDQLPASTRAKLEAAGKERDWVSEKLGSELAGLGLGGEAEHFATLYAGQLQPDGSYEFQTEESAQSFALATGGQVKKLVQQGAGGGAYPTAWSVTPGSGQVESLIRAVAKGASVQGMLRQHLERRRPVRESTLAVVNTGWFKAGNKAPGGGYYPADGVWAVNPDRQVFESGGWEGSTNYFMPLVRLKNGNLKGFMYELRPRGGGSAKQTSVSKSDLDRWTLTTNVPAAVASKFTGLTMKVEAIGEGKGMKRSALLAQASAAGGKYVGIDNSTKYHTFSFPSAEQAEAFVSGLPQLVRMNAQQNGGTVKVFTYAVESLGGGSARPPFARV